MGLAYRRNWKNVQGGPDIIGRDVWELSGAVGMAPAAAAALTDGLGNGDYIAGADLRFEGVMVQATGTLGLGRVGVDVLLDGVVVASGNLYAGGPASQYIKLAKELNADVAVPSGSSLTANVSVGQTLDAGQVVRASLSLAILEGPEK